MTHAFFVTGTDTGVGKTTISAGLLFSLRRHGHTVAALKPVETGCRRDPKTGELVPKDALLLRTAAGLEALPLGAVVPYRYSLPVTPAVAARHEGLPISFAALRDAYAKLRDRAPRLLLVEGAGGLLSPLTDSHLGADLARELGLPLLVIARASLGTINHTLLTVNEAHRRGLAVAGILLNRTSATRGADEESNAAEIARLTHVPVLGTVEHLPAPQRRDPDRLADAVDSALDLATWFKSGITAA